MSKELQLARRIRKLERQYRHTMIELGHYYAHKQNHPLKSDDEAMHYGAGVYSGLVDQLPPERHHHAD